MCRRPFKDESVNVGGWIAMNLDAEVWHEAEMVWGKKVRIEGRIKWTNPPSMISTNSING
jgi:uncharacterized protein YdeI (BOF family)